MTSHLRLFGAFLLAICSFWAKAQSPQELAQLDPSDIYFQAWLHSRDGKALEKKKKYSEAFDKYNQARVLFNTIAVSHPSFKPDLVADRQKLTAQAIEGVHQQALAEQKAKKADSGTFIEGSSSVVPGNSIPAQIDLSPPNTRNVERLREDIRNLKRQLSEAINDRDANAAKLRRSLTQLEAEKAREVTAAVQGQLNRYKNEINRLTRENQAMSLSLSEVRQKYRKSLEQLKLTQKALKESRTEEERLRVVIQQQTDVNSRVIKGQQDQIDSLRREIKKKDQLYAKSLAQIKNLELQLEQSHTMVTEISKERDEAIQERDHIASILKVANGDRIQSLIDQNVGLSKELNEAKRRVEILEEAENTTKEELLNARSTLVVAKHKILNLQKQSSTQEESITELKKRLTLAETDLVNSANAGQITAKAREEAEMLRDIIQKQKDHMKIQEETGKLLLAEVKRMGQKNQNFAQAAQQLEGTFAPVLTEEEEQIIEDAGTDYTITSPYRNTEESLATTNSALRSFTGELNRVASRFFKKKDYQAARGNLEMVIEEDPGDWKAMVNLGIVQLNLDDPAAAAQQFRQAITVAADHQSPHAHFMLGVAYKETELYQDAEMSLRTSLKLKPENAKAHVLLGNIAGNQGRYQDAEIEFLAAIKINPSMWEPHRNLAQIFIFRGNLTKARSHYQSALKLGAPADLRLEKALGTSS